MDESGKLLEHMSHAEVRALVETLEARNEELTELAISELTEAGEFAQVQLALDDIGWRPLMGVSDDSNTLTLDGLQRASELCRAVATVNPLVKRGLLVRTGYIWGAGVQVVPQEFIQYKQQRRVGRPRTVNQEPKLPDGLDNVLTGVLAQIEIERSAACDGNLFFLVDMEAKTVQRVPLSEVTDGISQRGNREKLMYIKRSWNDWALELDDDSVERRPITNPGPGRGRRVPEQSPSMAQQGGMSGAYNSEWYPTVDALADEARTSIQGEPVNRSKVMVHVAFNRLTGWRWGVPDVLPAVWWTKAYKEYLENCSTLAKAYARFAWKVTSDRSRTVRRTASTMAAPPARDPATGMPLAIGASAVLGAGQDLTAIQRNTNVDFEGGRPLAAMVAASLDVPLPALTCDPASGTRAGTATLDTSTVLVMQARQKAMNDAIMLIFKLLGLKVRLRWPEINEEPVHRRLQAIDMSARLGVLSAAETRAMVLDAWNGKWNDFPADPPRADELPLSMRGKVMAAQSGQVASVAGKLSAVDGTGQSGLDGPKQPDPMSRGDHELRDEGGQAHTDTQN